jgi:VWFA-related protein
MARSRSLVLVLGAAVVACLSVTVRSQQTPPDPRPQATFKTGIDVVQLDVSVFDKDRRPIRGLTKDDFTILENGKAQPIEAVIPVEITEPTPPSAAWLRDAPLEVVTNRREARRLVAIVMDDATTGFDHGEPASARKIANAILDQLSPDDLVSVVFTFLGRPQNWTADRSRIRAAIESFNPKTTSGPLLSVGSANAPAGAPSPRSAAPPGEPPPPPSALSKAMTSGQPVVCLYRHGGCLVDTLKNVATVLEDAPPGRKILMLISSDGGLRIQDPDQAGYPQDMLRALQRANVTVYAFDPRGLTTERFQQETDDLWSIAAETGGFAAMHTNAPELRVSNAFRESSSYYLIGFRPPDTKRDGRFRRIEVKVNRPGADVRTRGGYYLPNDPKSRSNARKSAVPLDAALTGVVPTGDLPITVSVAAFAIPGRRDAVLTLVSGLAQTGVVKGSTHSVRAVAAVFDSNGKGYGAHRQTLELKPRSDQLAFDLYSRIPSLKPGRYEVRFAAESEGRAGSVFMDVDVPDFAKEELAFSGVLVERTPSRTVANPAELTSVTSVRPTAARIFASTDRIRATLRVYQKEKRSVKLTARVVNERDESVFGRTDDLEAAAFANGAADYQLEVPIAPLPSGQYLLTIEATAAGKRLTRDVRFVVR